MPSVLLFFPVPICLTPGLSVSANTAMWRIYTQPAQALSAVVFFMWGFIQSLTLYYIMAIDNCGLKLHNIVEPFATVLKRNGSQEPLRRGILISYNSIP